MGLRVKSCFVMGGILRRQGGSTFCIVHTVHCTLYSFVVGSHDVMMVFKFTVGRRTHNTMTEMDNLEVKTAKNMKQQ